MKSSNSHYKLREIKLELSYNCNLECVHCSSEGGALKSNTIPYDQVERIINSASNMGVETISISGGEPMLISYLDSLVKLCHRNNIHTKIYSNGTCDFSTKIELFKQSSVEIAISLFSNRENRHNQITKCSASFIKTSHNIKLLSSSSIKTEIHFVPLKNNYGDLRNLVIYANTLGVNKVSVLRFVPQGRGAINDLNLNKDMYLELKKSILELRKEGHLVRTGSPMNFLFLNKQPTCNSGITRVVIGPDLSIYPCDAFKQIQADKIVGPDEYSNLSIHSLEECWTKSLYLNEIRRYAANISKSSCGKCSHFDVCHGGCLAQKVLFNGKYYGQPDPLCIATNNEGN